MHAWNNENWTNTALDIVVIVMGDLMEGPWGDPTRKGLMSMQYNIMTAYQDFFKKS